MTLMIQAGPTGAGCLRAWARGLVSMVLCLVAAVAWAAPKAKTPYEYYLVGQAADAAPSQPPSGAPVVLMGGGPDVDAAFAWMIAKAGGGDFVVLRARGTDGYNGYIYAMGGVDSVETLVVPDREAASDPFVVDRIDRAEAVFIAGGDQSDYVLQWKDTPLSAALARVVARQAPLGGTSAGLAVLGEFDFAALRGSVTSTQALDDPYDRRVTLDREFLVAPGLGSTVTDAHLDSRDRMGRLLTFVARVIADGWTTVAQARGIGLDVETALAIEHGVAVRLGVGSAYFLRPAIAPSVCLPKQPLTFRNVHVDRLAGAGAFDLGVWAGRQAGDVVGYDISAEAGVLVSSQLGGSVY